MIKLQVKIALAAGFIGMMAILRASHKKKLVDVPTPANPDDDNVTPIKKGQKKPKIKLEETKVVIPENESVDDSRNLAFINNEMAATQAELTSEQARMDKDLAALDKFKKTGEEFPGPESGILSDEQFRIVKANISELSSKLKRLTIEKKQASGFTLTEEEEAIIKPGASL